MKNHFKSIAMLIILAFSISIMAQKENRKSREFIRVFNLEGKKTNKGHFKFINDSLLGIRHGRKLVQINVKDIGYIKTKHTVGHNLLVGSAVGLGTGMLVGAATSNERTKTVSYPNWFTPGYYQRTHKTGMSSSEGALVGGVLGLTGGSLVGLISSIFKNSQTVIINGDIKNLKTFTEILSK